MGRQGGQRGVSQVEPVGKDLGQIGAGRGVVFQEFQDLVASARAFGCLRFAYWVVHGSLSLAM